MTKDIFDMSRVRILKEIEKKKMGGMFIVCYVFGLLSSVIISLKEPNAIPKYL